MAEDTPTNGLPGLSMDDVMRLLGERDLMIDRLTRQCVQQAQQIEALCNTPLPTPMKAAKTKAS